MSASTGDCRETSSATTSKPRGRWHKPARRSQAANPGSPCGNRDSQAGIRNAHRELTALPQDGWFPDVLPSPRRGAIACSPGSERRQARRPWVGGPQTTPKPRRGRQHGRASGEDGGTHRGSEKRVAPIGRHLSGAVPKTRAAVDAWAGARLPRTSSSGLPGASESSGRTCRS